jgi:hypothetical protein
MGMYHGKIEHFSCFLIYEIFDSINAEQGLGDFGAQM